MLCSTTMRMPAGQLAFSGGPTVGHDAYGRPSNSIQSQPSQTSLAGKVSGSSATPSQSSSMPLQVSGTPGQGPGAPPCGSPPSPPLPPSPVEPPPPVLGGVPPVPSPPPP